MRMLRCFGAGCFALALATARPARADDDAFSDTARELFVKGMKAHDEQKWDQCRAALLAAFAIKKHWQIAGNLAECEMRLGAYRDAAEHAWFFAHTLRPDVPAERRAAAEAALRETQQKVGMVMVTVDVDDADVLVDGKSAGKSPLTAPVFVDAGRHTVEALHAGDTGVRVTVDLGAGIVREVELTLRKKRVPPAAIERRPSWPAIAAGGVALVALGVGTGLTVAANAKGTDADTLGKQVGGPSACFGAGATSATCVALLNALTSKSTLSDGAFAAVLTGGIAAAGAAGLGIWAALTPPRVRSTGARVQILPAVGARDARVIAIGAW
jgi:hypothetical protein